MSEWKKFSPYWRDRWDLYETKWNINEPLRGKVRNLITWDKCLSDEEIKEIFEND